MAFKLDETLQVEASKRPTSAKNTARLFKFFFGHDPSCPVPWADNQASGAVVAHRLQSIAKELSGGRRMLFRCGCPGAGATVLVQGESGTGKEIIANAIHVHSQRRRNHFVKVNCAALSETLLESELFGHVKGAFTGAVCDRCGRFKQADGGTILLDEIGSMSLAGQAKLLRVLQEHEFEPVGSSVTLPVNVRVLASSNIDLAAAVNAGKFREDLYYRLNVFEIALPPLRERKEDILLLAQHFLRRHSRALEMNVQGIAPETGALLLEYDWPGNVRELANAMEHAVIIEKGSVVLPSSLPMTLAASHSVRGDCQLLTEDMGLREKLTILERQILLDTLSRAHGIKKHTAAMLGIDARNLPYLLRKHRLSS